MNISLITSLKVHDLQDDSEWYISTFHM